MTSDQIITLVILAIAIILFATNRIRIDLVALMVLVSLGLTGVFWFQQLCGDDYSRYFNHLHRPPINRRN